MRKEAMRVVVDSFHNEERSLKDEIEYLCNPDNSIEKDQVLSLLLKYWYGYQHKKTNKVSTQKIAKRFARFCAKSSRYGDYQAQMLADLPTTAEIFTEIVKQKVSLNLEPGEKALGFDAGAGTGILLLAQHILACRNDVRDQVELIGAELDSRVVTKSNKLCKQLFGGKVDGMDLRDKELYEHYEGRRLFCLTNENITNEGSFIDDEPFRAVKENVARYFDASEAYIFPEKIYTADKENRAQDRFWGINLDKEMKLLSQVGDGYLAWLEKQSKLKSEKIRDLLADPRWNPAPLSAITPSPHCLPSPTQSSD